MMRLDREDDVEDGRFIACYHGTPSPTMLDYVKMPLNTLGTAYIENKKTSMRTSVATSGP